MPVVRNGSKFLKGSARFPKGWERPYASDDRYFSRVPAGVRLYKRLNGAMPANNGKGAWSLPKRRPGAGWQPGEWREVSGIVVACRNGLHLTELEDLPNWQGTDLYEAEVDGGIVRSDKKWVARRVRLVRKIRSFDAARVGSGSRWGSAKSMAEAVVRATEVRFLVRATERRQRAILDARGFAGKTLEEAVLETRIARLQAKLDQMRATTDEDLVAARVAYNKASTRGLRAPELGTIEDLWGRPGHSYYNWGSMVYKKAEERRKRLARHQAKRVSREMDRAKKTPAPSALARELGVKVLPFKYAA